MTADHALITTLCLNPALDITYHVDKLIADQKSRSDAARHDPGGNGINIGRAFKRMNIEAHTFCVVAGAIGRILQALLEQQLDHVYYEHVDGETRINSTIIEMETRQQFQVTDAGTALSPAQLEKITTDFLTQSQNGFSIITGSCQPGIKTSLYAELVDKINQQGGMAVVDSHGDILRQAIEAKPYLIKPNKYELEILLHSHLPTIEAVAHSARNIQKQGIEYVCVSLSKQGALLIGPENSYYAKALDVPVNTTVGAGDSMVAGLVAGFQTTGKAEEALRYAIACGAGTVMHPGTELFTGDELADFRQRVRIEVLDI